MSLRFIGPRIYLLRPDVYKRQEYHSVYEAGFCGFWIHERLTALGIDNIVVNPEVSDKTVTDQLFK